MDSLKLSKKHEVVWLPIDSVMDNPNNPNAMNDREFNLLVDNIESKGVTEYIEVRDLGDGTYRTIGGHHRKKACNYLGWTEIPCLINRDPEMDDDKENFQMVRMNMIRGKLDPEKFLNLYDKMSKKYEADLIQDMMGFADEAEFNKLIKETAAGLPHELKAEFQKAAKEVRTIEDLAKVLNRLFAQGGDSLQWGYMVFDYEGHDSVWIRMLKKHRLMMDEVFEVCREKDRALDDLVMELFSQLVKEGSPLLQEVLKNTKECDKKAPNHIAPTHDNSL